MGSGEAEERRSKGVERERERVVLRYMMLRMGF